MKKLKLPVMLFCTSILVSCAIAEVAMLNWMETTEFRVVDRSLYMSGVINSKTPNQLREVLDTNPGLEEIVLLDVPGSVDDEANLIASRMVRDAGLNTRLRADSEIASGGTDFFTAGVERRAADGARVGVHSWGEPGGKEGRDYPRNHKYHRLYLDFYAAMNIPARFYWFTLEVASADDIYWMSRDELLEYQIVTQR